ncbi:MAG TPA: hypothetical protein VG166_14825 [Caulobacteraceae bacterium]|jgi:hypothetical protein|nr:hypothetical protein [Caulobacteraceae bacterium]
MTKTAVAALAAVLLLSASGAVVAATDSAPATTPAQQAQVSPAKAAAEDKVICRSDTPTGSRLGAKKTCMKKSDWDKQAAAAREMMLHRPPQAAGPSS